VSSPTPGAEGTAPRREVKHQTLGPTGLALTIPHFLGSGVPLLRSFEILANASTSLVEIRHVVRGFIMPLACGLQVPFEGLHAMSRDPVAGELIRGPILPANRAAKGRCLSLF
jgi:hypothetical protein